MSTKTNARLAGFMFLFYIANAIAVMVLSTRASAGHDAVARLGSIAQHAQLFRWTNVLILLTGIDAIVLGAALWALTRVVDRDLATMALCFRVAEGVVGAMGAVKNIGLLNVALQCAGVAGVAPVATFLLQSSGTNVGATLFAIGSTIFAALFLRGRLIPSWLAWLGIVSSALIAIALPLQLAGVALGLIGTLMWLPILVFEVVLAFWLLIKGVTPPAGT